MPVFDYCKVGVSEDCGEFYLEDKTVYGVAPDDRASYALYLAGFFYQVNEDDIRLVIDNSIPESVVTWTIPDSSDGYYYFDLLPILVWKSTLSFSIGDICYQNTFYWKALTNNSNVVPTDNEGTDWEKVEDPYLEVGNLNALGNPVIEQVTRYNTGLLCRANNCYSEVVAKFSESCDECSNSINRDLVKVDALLQDAYILFDQKRYTDGHKVALLLQDICNDLTDCGCS